MPIEQYTESIVLQEMKCALGENNFGFCFPQGDVEQVDKLEKALKKAGGKPPVCILNDYSQGGNGKAKPEYIVTLNIVPMLLHNVLTGYYRRHENATKFRQRLQSIQ
jgi:hypothetical protein